MILELYKASLNEGTRKVFANLSFLVDAGQRLAVTGGTARDRTLLLQVLLGLRRLDDGWACLDGSPVLPRLGSFYRGCMGYVPSSMGMGGVSVGQLARYAYGEQANRGLKYDAGHVAESLRPLGVDAAKCLDTRFDALDRATAQRVLIGLTFMFNRPVALLDNPTSAQDDEGRARVVDFLSSPRFDSVAMLVATDDEALMQACHKVVRI